MKKARLYLNVIIACLSLISLVYYVWSSIPVLGHTGFDDAFMITRYAKHWLAGEGFSWNAKDGPAYGITSPAYLFIITFILWVTRCSDGVAVTYTSFGAGLFSLIALTGLGFLVQKNKYTDKLLWPLLVIPYVIFLTPLNFHSLTGMETTLSLFSNALLACAIIFFVRQPSFLSVLFCLFAGVFVFLTRPDNGLYAFVLPSMLLVAYEKNKWRYALWYILLFSFAAGFILIMNKFLFSDYLPLPFYAKTNGFFKGYSGVYKWSAMRFMLETLLTWLPCLVLIVVTLSKKERWKVAIIFFTIIATFAYYATVTQIMGFYARYYYPSLAFVLLATDEALASRVEIRKNQASTNPYRRRLLSAGVLLLPLVLIFTLNRQIISFWDLVVIGTPNTFYSNTQYRTFSNKALPHLGWQKSIYAMNELLQSLPKETVIAASEYGWIGSQHPNLIIIDLIGLHDRKTAHNGFSAAYVLSQEPDLIWFPPPEYTYEIAKLLDNADFIQNYEYYPGAWDYGIALDKRSAFFPELKCKVSTEFSKIYPGLDLSDYLAQSNIDE